MSDQGLLVRSDWLLQLSLTIWGRGRDDRDILLRQLPSEPLRHINKLHPLTPVSADETPVTMATASTTGCGEQKQEVVCPTGMQRRKLEGGNRKMGSSCLPAQIRFNPEYFLSSTLGSTPMSIKLSIISQLCHHMLDGRGRGHTLTVVAPQEAAGVCGPGEQNLKLHLLQNPLIQLDLCV